MAVRLLMPLLGLLLFSCQCVFAKNLFELIKSKPNLSMMSKILENDTLIPTLMDRLPFTAFLPSDDALRNYTGPNPDYQFISYHLSNQAILIQDAEKVITSYLSGNPPLYVTKVPNSKPSITGWEDHDYYINNALVITANQKATASDGSEQVLHIIDEVMAPTRKSVGKGSIPTAGGVIEEFQSYGYNDETSIARFQERVKELDEMNVFESKGINTYFIPVDKLVTSDDEQVTLNKHTINGHIIPDVALFTRPTSSSEEPEWMESAAFADNLKVLLKISKVADSKNNIGYYATSNTLVADMQHPKGTSMARIIKGNIPVSNGVIHLIDRPLMSTADSIFSYLSENGGQLSSFYNLFREFKPDLLKELRAADSMTLFAPSNYAFSLVKKETLDLVSMSDSKLSELLKLHMVRGRLTTEEIEKRFEKAGKDGYSSRTLSGNRPLYFTVNNEDKDKQPIIHADGGGVNATIVTPNIVAKNGVIHILDRVLDIPSQTIFEKLKSIPRIRTSYNLTSQNSFNEQFNQRKKKFTLFVPDDEAWKAVQNDMPSSFKKLSMGVIPKHVEEIFQRHMIVGRDLSIKDLTALTNNQQLAPNDPEHEHYEMEMTRGKIFFEPRVSAQLSEYYVTWQGKRALVTQPDIECVNGVIHIIDKVLMDQVPVSGTGEHFSGALATLLLTMLLSAMLR